MKVEIITAGNTQDLERKINSFLNDINDSQIIDIKYQGVGNQAPYSLDCPSAMVIMKY